jgi:hypothetical protein
MTRDCHIVRGIGKYHLGAFGAQNLPVALGDKRISTQDAVFTKEPKIARPSNWHSFGVNFDPFVFLVEAQTVQMKIDLAHLKAADLEIDLRCKLQNLGEFEGECIAVPRRIVGDPVERKPQQPQLCFRKIRQTNRWHLAQAHLPCGEDQTPARDDSSARIDQDRQDEAEPVEAVGELAQLLGRVLAGLAAERQAARDRNEFGIQIARNRIAVRAELGSLVHVPSPA